MIRPLIAIWACIALITATSVLNATTDGRQTETLKELKGRVDRLDTEIAVLATTTRQLAEKTVYAVSLKATVTGYTSRAAETDDTPCIAAWGHNICKLKKAGFNICASNDFQLGTKIEIENLGTCIVMDRMNSRFTGQQRIDWYFGDDLKAAKEFGVKKLNAYTGTAL